MSQVLKAQQMVSDNVSVYVANHYRAIADLAMSQLLKGQMPMTPPSQSTSGSTPRNK
jgi:hypothetical protein